jgi:hypothetical protein
MTSWEGFRVDYIDAIQWYALSFCQEQNLRQYILRCDDVFGLDQLQIVLELKRTTGRVFANIDSSSTYNGEV